ncbi:hypothetical protein CEP52_008356 [Fusarium oligoseptatum]|uniref:Mitochondrial genome maintenance protein MGM101 n=1 Tax=Fusarium oligoseptatum TaxID=2604345 RepID=A0A428TID4_9HYPO|nr:hypothetical protein CEP52_008356 [Fusarium oligoseptatum]
MTPHALYPHCTPEFLFIRKHFREPKLSPAASSNLCLVCILDDIPTHSKFTMFVPRRALFTARRLPFARARSIAPLMRYSTAAPSATDVPSTTENGDNSTSQSDVTLQKPAEDVTQVNQEDVSTPKTSSKTAAKPAVKAAVKPVPTPTYARAKPVTKAKAAAPAKAASTQSGPSNPYQPAPVAEKSLSESKPPQEPIGSPQIWDGKHSHKPQEVDWEKSWFGIGSKPVTAEQNKVLARPVNPDDVEVKPDGIVYLPEVKYRRRLNEAFGPMGWGMVNRGDVVVGTNIVTREYALIVNGRFVSQAQGVNNYFSAEGLPAAIEGCKSNALMRCCKDLGIASELWDPVFLRWFRKHYMEERWVEHVTTKKKRTFWYKKGLAEPVYPYKLV